MKERYGYTIEIQSSLASYQRANGHQLLCTEDVPISITLKLKTIDNTVTEDSTVAVSYYMFDSCKDSAIMITLYNDLGYIIGKTTFHTATSVSDGYQMYRDHDETKQLKLGDILQHIPADATEADFHVDIEVDSFKAKTSVREDSMSHDFNWQMRHMECTAPPVKFQLSENAKIQSDAANNDHNDAIIQETRNTDDSNVVLCDRYKIQRLMNKSEYFMKRIPKTPNEDDQVTVSINNVDPKIFQTFLDFVYYEKCVYVKTEDTMPLQQCCREMLEIADRFLCPALARDCAECIVQVTSKDTVFTDIPFLATHYNGPNKLEIFGEMGKKLEELQPKEHLEQLLTLCQQLPDVAAYLLYGLTISAN